MEASDLDVINEVTGQRVLPPDYDGDIDMMQDLLLLAIEVRHLLESMARPREYDCKLVIVPDRREKDDIGKVLAEERKAHSDWELEAIRHVTGGRVTPQTPNGSYVELWLRRPKYVYYPTSVEEALHGRLGALGAAARLQEREAKFKSQPPEQPEPVLAEPLLTVPDACTRFGMRRDPVMGAIKSGELPAVRDATVRGKAHTGTFRLRLNDVERWHSEVYSKLPPPKLGRPPKQR